MAENVTQNERFVLSKVTPASKVTPFDGTEYVFKDESKLSMVMALCQWTWPQRVADTSRITQVLINSLMENVAVILN